MSTTIETNVSGSRAPTAASPDASTAPLPLAAPQAVTPPGSTSLITRTVQGRENPRLALEAPQLPACPRKPAPADGTRRLVISHPYDNAGERSGEFEVLDVRPDGALRRPGRTFTLGSVASGTIDFTPDNQVGLVALDNGTIGVFRLAADGQPTVVHQGFAGKFTAGKVVVAPSGDSALVIDPNTRENGGGIYAVGIGCDGTLTDRGLVLPAKAPGGIAFTGNRAVVAAADAGEPIPPPSDKRPADNVHLFDWTTTPTRAGSTEAFGNDQVIVGGTALSGDGKTFLIGDKNQFGDFQNQVAAVEVRDNGLRPIGVVDVPDPESIAASPFGQVAIVASPLSDAIYVLDRGGANGAWQVRGQVKYNGAGPALPGDLAAVDRGKLRGHVFVSENVSIRHLAFKEDGSVVDLGSLPLGEDLKSISGAIGVTH